MDRWYGEMGICSYNDMKQGRSLVATAIEVGVCVVSMA